MTLPSLEKPTFIRPIRLGRARPMNVSSSRLMRIITGALTFFESSAGMTSDTPPVTLLPKPPPVYSLIRTTLPGSMFNHLRDGRHGLRGALRTGVDVDFAVLPVSHGGARFERLVAGVWRDECFVQD